MFIQCSESSSRRFTPYKCGFMLTYSAVMVSMCFCLCVFHEMKCNTHLVYFLKVDVLHCNKVNLFDGL